MDVSLIAPWASLFVSVGIGITALVKMRREIDVLNAKFEAMEARMNQFEQAQTVHGEKIDRLGESISQGVQQILQRLATLEAIERVKR